MKQNRASCIKSVLSENLESFSFFQMKSIPAEGIIIWHWSLRI